MISVKLGFWWSLTWFSPFPWNCGCHHFGQEHHSGCTLQTLKLDTFLLLQKTTLFYVVVSCQFQVSELSHNQMLKPGKQSLYKKEAGHQRTGLKNHRFQVKNWSKSVTQRESRQSLELILLPLGSCCSSCCLCHSLIFQHSDLLLMLHTLVPNKAYAAHQSFFLRTSYGAKNLLSTGQSSISFRILFCASNTLTCLRRHEKSTKIP